MSLFLINFVLCLIWAFIYTSISPQNARQKKSVLLLMLIQLWFVHSFIDCVPDVPLLKERFLAMKGYSYVDIIQFNTECSFMEPGWLAFCKTITLFSDNFTIVMAINSFFLLFFYYKSINEYSPYIMLSWILFVLINYNQSLFVLRQTLVMSLCVFSYKYIIESRKWPFILCMIAGTLIHKTCIIFSLLYLIYNLRNKKLFYLTILVMVVVLSVGYSQLMGSFSELLSYEHYNEAETGMNWTGFLISLVLFVTYIAVLRKRIYDDGINRIVFISLLISTLGLLFGSQYSGYGASRLYEYFSIAAIFSIPITAKYLADKNLRVLFIFVVTILYFILAYRRIIEDDSFWDMIVTLHPQYKM